MTDDRTDDGPAVCAALGAASREKADGFLEEQTVLTRLQADDLRREDRLRHWSLVVHHISDVLKLAFEFAVAMIVLAIVAVIGTAVWKADHDNSLVIEAFSVPPDMAARGLTGEAVAAQLQDRLAALQDATDSARPADSYANNWGGDIKVQIPNTGISVGQFYQLLADWLGHQTRITGEIWRSGSAISITARAGSDGAATVAGAESELPSLLQKAAEAIYLQTQPYRYAVYVQKDGAFSDGSGPKRLASARAIFQRLSIEGSTSRERAWATLGFGTNALYRGDAGAAVANDYRALAIMPDFPLAWSDVDQLEGWLGHDQPQLIAARTSARQLGSGDVDMTERARAILLVYEQADVAAYQGDFQSARSENDAASHLPDYSGSVEGVRETAVSDLAMLHEGNAARAAWRSLPPADAATEDGRLWNKPLIDYEAGDWRAVLADRAAAQAALQRTYSRNQAATLLWPYFARATAETGNLAGAEALIAKTPRDCDVCVRVRGHIDARQKNWAGAAYWFGIVAARSPDIPFADADWGEMLLAKGDLDGAIAKFASANRKGPHFADPLEMWGEALMARNRSDLALAKFAEAAKYAPNWGRLHLKWGEALLWSGDKAGARKQFVIAFHLDLTPSEKSQLARMEAVHG